MQTPASRTHPFLSCKESAASPANPCKPQAEGPQGSPPAAGSAAPPPVPAPPERPAGLPSHPPAFPLIYPNSRPIATARPIKPPLRPQAISASPKPAGSTRIGIILAAALLLFGVFTLSDYLAVTQFNQVPRFRIATRYDTRTPDQLVYQTLFFTAVQQNPGTPDSKITIVK